MKTLLTLLVLLPLFSLAQADAGTTYYANDTLYTRSGFKIVQNQKLKIGSGSLPSGAFRYIRISSYSIFRQSSNKAHNGSADQVNSFSPHNAGLEYVVIRIDRRGNSRQSFHYFPIISGGLVRYEIDIDNAIAAGEIVIPDEYKEKKPQ